MEKTERFNLSKKDIVCERYELESVMKSEAYRDFYLDLIEDPAEEGLYGGWIFHKDYDSKMLASELNIDLCGGHDDMIVILLNQIINGKSVEAYREYYMDDEE